MEKSIIKKRIKEIYKNKPVRMHMPGHKGKKHDLRFDITEVDGADNLHNPHGILKDVEKKIADIYGAGESFLLVGGSTAGVQASLMSLLDENDQVLIPTNAHRSVYPALSFTRAKPVYYKPEPQKFGMAVTGEQIERLIRENPNVKAVLVVSPDYYGNISELKKIRDVTEKRGVKLIVDEAHGAHLHFLPDIEDANSINADYVIQSTHKILGAPTQGALLHINGEVEGRRVRKILSLIESSSPSYFLLSGIEEAVDEAKEKAEEKFYKIYHAHDALEGTQNQENPFLLVPPGENYDKSKFLFTFPPSYNLAAKLKELKIIPELISGDKVLFMTGTGTNQRDLDRLFTMAAVVNRDLKDRGFKSHKSEPTVETLIEPYNTQKELYEVIGKSGELVKIDEALDRVCLEFIVPYPPGIPYLIPGSLITKENIDVIKKLIKDNYAINGLDTDEKENILIEVL